MTLLTNNLIQDPARIRKKWRGSWAVSSVFARCPKCTTGLRIHGVCQSCGYTTVCAWCHSSVKQSDGSWRPMRVDVGPNTSHGMCTSCRAKHFPKRGQR